MTSCLRRKFRAIFLALAIADSMRQQTLTSIDHAPTLAALSAWPMALVATAQGLIQGEPMPTPWANPPAAGSTANPPAIALLHHLPLLLVSLDAEPSPMPTAPETSNLGDGASAADPGELIRWQCWLHQALLRSLLPPSAVGGKGDRPLHKPPGSMSELIHQAAPSLVGMAEQAVSRTHGQLGLALPLGLQTRLGQEAGSLELIAVMAAALGGYSSLPLGWQWTYLQAPATAVSWGQRWGLGQMADLLAIADGLYSRWAGITPTEVRRQGTDFPGSASLPLAVSPSMLGFHP